MPTFANTIDNNEILAKRSQCDYAGADIQTTYATKTEVTTGLASKQDTISDLATIRSGAADGATAVQPGDLATVATTGAYSDLTGAPTIVDNGKIYGMDGTESYNDIYTKMVVDGIGITWVLKRVSPYAGKATYTACGITSDDASDTYGYLRLACVMRAGNSSQQITVFLAEAHGGPTGFGTPTYSLSSTPIGSLNQVYSWNSNGSAIARSINEVPSYTTSEDGKVLCVVDNQGAAELQWATPSGGSVTDVKVNGTSVVNASGVAEVTVPSGAQLVPAATSSDADKVLTVDSQGTPTWSTPAAGGVTDVEVDGTSVVSGGVASITMPTVDQTYNSASTDAQSGVAVAGALSTKQDTISDLATIRSGAADGATAVQPGDLATVATSGAYSDLSGAPTILPYKPVVAGTGVRIVDDTANNRIVVEADETVLWHGTASSSTILLSESAENFERVKILYKINDGISSSVEVMPNSSGVKVGMCTMAFYSSKIRMKGTFYTLQGTSLTPEANSAVASGTQSGTLSISVETGTFYVLQVIGINRIASN